MKQRHENQLLNGVFGEETLEALRQGTLQSGLVNVRRWRRTRRILRVSAFVCAPVIIALAVVFPKIISLHPAHNLSRDTATPPGASDKVKIISDEELFRLFPNRSMVLVGQPGHQELVFLDQPEKTVKQ